MYLIDEGKSDIIFRQADSLGVILCENMACDMGRISAAGDLLRMMCVVALKSRKANIPFSHAG